MLKILACHNYYLIRGGEDQSYEDEVQLLRSKGHEVVTYTENSATITSGMAVASRLIWSRETFRKLTEVVRREKPDVVHFTNTFPLISLSGPAAAHGSGVPVVASMRNYRSLCAGAYFLRDGKVCEKCLGRSGSLPAIIHKCYRESRLSSIALAGVIAWQRTTKQWERQIDIFYTPSDFARAKLIQGGFPSERILVKPNFVQNDPAPGSGEGGFALFAGRLSPEKGLDVILSAWKSDSTLPPLRIVGEGPLESVAVKAAGQDSRIRYLGKLSHAQLLDEMGQAAFLLMTSIWYETFGRTMVEAYSKSTPVIASNMGCMAELVQDGKTGFLFEPGNSKALADAIHKYLGQPELVPDFRNQCRQIFEAKYMPERNYELLKHIYQTAIDFRKSNSQS